MTICSYYLYFKSSVKVAKLLAEGITSTDGNEAIVNNVKKVNLKKEASYDLILIGSPVHFGKHLGLVKKFINKLPKSQLKVNAYSIFDTYMAGDPETTKEGVCCYTKMVDNIEKQINEKLPDLTKVSSGLLIKVEG